MNDNTIPTNSALTRRIMRRVYLVYGLRMLIHPTFLKSLIALLIISRSTAYISYGNVFANAPSFFDIPRNLAFARGALMHTETATLFLLTGVTMVLAWIASDMLRQRAHSF